MSKDIRLTDGTILEIKINFLTIKILEELQLHKLEKKMEENPNDEKIAIEVASKILYAIIRSNGRKVDEEEALMLIPCDETAIQEIMRDFGEQFEKIKKKESSNKKNTKKLSGRK